jgi:8-oxo-dGTP pyrophosphatase MutT (NUDIX family)
MTRATSRWRTRNREVVLDRSPWLVVEDHTVELPTGQVIDGWSWIRTPDYVTVAAISRDGDFICFRQNKYAVDGLTLAVVGGYLEPDEPPLDAAKRELREETGYEAEDWTDLGTYAVDANRGNGRAHVFLAEGAVRVGEPDGDDLEDQELLVLSRDDVVAALLRGEFKVISWAATIAIALTRLGDR